MFQKITNNYILKKIKSHIDKYSKTFMKIKNTASKLYIHI